MVERHVEAEVVEQRLALLLPAGDADGSRALDLGDLADGRPDGSGGRCDDDGLARLWLADLEQPGVRREAGHAEHAERRGDGYDGRVEAAHAGAVGDRVGLPAGVGERDVAGLPFRRSATPRRRRRCRPRAGHPPPPGRSTTGRRSSGRACRGRARGRPRGAAPGRPRGRAARARRSRSSRRRARPPGVGRGELEWKQSCPGGYAPLSGRCSARGVQGVGHLHAPRVRARCAASCRRCSGRPARRSASVCPNSPAWRTRCDPSENAHSWVVAGLPYAGPGTVRHPFFFRARRRRPCGRTLRRRGGRRPMHVPCCRPWRSRCSRSRARRPGRPPGPAARRRCRTPRSDFALPPRASETAERGDQTAELDAGHLHRRRVQAGDRRGGGLGRRLLLLAAAGEQQEQRAPLPR